MRSDPCQTWSQFFTARMNRIGDRFHNPNYGAGRTNANRPKLAEVYATMEKLCACALPPIGGTRDPGVGPHPRPTYQAVAWSAESAYRPFP